MIAVLQVGSGLESWFRRAINPSPLWVRINEPCQIYYFRVHYDEGDTYKMRVER
jgi:hypothetical protein